MPLGRAPVGRLDQQHRTVGPVKGGEESENPEHERNKDVGLGCSTFGGGCNGCGRDERGSKLSLQRF